MEREVSKAEFKKIFMEHLGDGWTQEYRDKFFENESGGTYLVRETQSSGATEMNIVDEGKVHRIVFLSEDDTESFSMIFQEKNSIMDVTYYYV